MGVRRIQTHDLPLKMSMSYHHIMVVFVIFSGMFPYTCLVQSFEIQTEKIRARLHACAWSEQAYWHQLQAGAHLPRELT